MQRINYGRVVDVLVDRVIESTVILRQTYDEGSLKELGMSIDERGLIYPILVDALPDETYGLIVGSRRLRSAKKLKLKTIPAVILNKMSTQEKLELALAENLHREDLTPFEEAWAILKLVNEYKLTLKQVAKCIKRDETFVRRRLQLLSLPQEVQGLVAEKKLNLTHVNTLTALTEPADQIRFARRIVEQHLNDGEFRTMIEEELGRPRTRKEKAFSWERSALKAKSFARYLGAVLPEGVEIERAHHASIMLDALEELAKAVDTSIKRVKKVR